MWETDPEGSKEQAAGTHGALTVQLEERLDLNLIISGMTQGSEEQFVTSQNEICLTAKKGKFKTGVKDIVLLAKEKI